MTGAAAWFALDAASLALLAAMLAIALANLRWAPRLEAAGDPRDEPLVSLLVPARDEAVNLRAHLPLWAAQEWKRLEVVVLDDGSADDTAAIVEAFAAQHPGRVRLVRGAPPPEGWVGKSWACHQLAARARGQILLFCDADVAPRPAAVRRTVALLRRWRAGAVTAVLSHRFGGWSERAVVPLVAQLPVAAALPLPLVPRTRSPSLSMANGQWLAFTRGAYDAAGGHAAVRGDVLEDVALGRLVKRSGFRLVTAIAGGEATVRMYAGLGEVRAGFRKNLYPLCGGSPLALAGVLAVFLLAMVYPLVSAARATPTGLAALAMLAALRLVAARIFRQSIATVLLHPVGAPLAAWIAMESAVAHWRGQVRWKGRSVSGSRSAGAPYHGRSPDARETDRAAGQPAKAGLSQS